VRFFERGFENDPAFRCHRQTAGYEETVLQKSILNQKQQLSDIRAHLHQQSLTSLELLRNDENIDIQRHEPLDLAKIFYNMRLYQQSRKL
jgi:hypothetical protein